MKGKNYLAEHRQLAEFGEKIECFKPLDTGVAGYTAVEDRNGSICSVMVLGTGNEKKGDLCYETLNVFSHI